MVLLTGASGYVGGRLLQSLARSGKPVRCLARRPQAVRNIPPGAEVVSGDVLVPSSLEQAMQGVESAYYLIHSMASGRSFEEEDRQAARNFGEAARRAGVRRIIYLGGLGDSSAELSPHLRSRIEVGERLRASGVPVIEFRASIVIGAGSLSFEMIRALVERLPVMIAPRWVSIEAQPIAVGDLLAYLLSALDLPPANRVFEIGGADRVSYGGLMEEYARQRGLKRLVIPVPVLTPRLSSLWLGLVTPLYVRVGRTLVDSIRHPTVVRDGAAAREFPIRPLGYREAIRAALAEEDEDYSPVPWPLPPKPQRGFRAFDSRIVAVDAPPQAAFAAIERIGGASGWYAFNWLWRLRGLLDRAVGGRGFRRGRRDPVRLALGDTLDFWRVERLESGRLLRLRAEMRLPGRAWLEFEVRGEGAGSLVRQTAMFDPAGILGRVYWSLVLPLHQLVFEGMLRGIKKQAEHSPHPLIPG